MPAAYKFLGDKMMRTLLCCLAWCWLAPFGFCQTPEKSFSSLERVTAHVGLFHDTVNVGVIRSHDRAILIGSGDGNILEAASSLGIKSIDWVLYTDHHRDQCEGAARLKQAGVKIAVPAGEAGFFRDATADWQAADTILYDRMDFRPDLFILRSSVEPGPGIASGGNVPLGRP